MGPSSFYLSFSLCLLNGEAGAPMYEESSLSEVIHEPF